MTTPHPQDLAYAFARALRAELTEDQMAEAIALNAGEANPSICHSHDFCDANIVMAEAFRAVVGRDIDLQSDADCALWGEAWDLAKRGKFAIGPQ